MENDFVCGKDYSVLQIVFDTNVLIEKVLVTTSFTFLIVYNLGGFCM